MDDAPQINKTTSIAALNTDKIWMYLNGKGNLSDQEQEYYNKMLAADDLIREYGRTTARKMLETRFEIKRRVAEQLCSDAMLAFGTKYKAEKDYYRQWAIDQLIKTISATAKEIHGEGDGVKPNLNPKLITALVNGISELRRVTGFDKEQDQELPDWSSLGANVIKITMDVKDLGITPIGDVEEFAKKILEEMESRSAEDADFEEL